MRAPTKVTPSQEALRGLFLYDARTGLLRWRHQSGEDRKALGFNNKCSGKIAGTVPKGKGNRAYRCVIVNDPLLGKRVYLAHRLIWKFMTGEEAPEQVDHIDGDRLNNAWANLRAADNARNMMNTAPRSISGFKGVYWCGHHRKWRAVVAFAGRIHSIGHFDTAELAAHARHQAATRIQGEFARTFA